MLSMLPQEKAHCKGADDAFFTILLVQSFDLGKYYPLKIISLVEKRSDVVTLFASPARDQCQLSLVAVNCKVLNIVN